SEVTAQNLIQPGPNPRLILRIPPGKPLPNPLNNGDLQPGFIFNVLPPAATGGLSGGGGFGGGGGSFGGGGGILGGGGGGVGGSFAGVGGARGAFGGTGY